MQFAYIFAGVAVLVHALVQLDLLRAARGSAAGTTGPPSDDAALPFVLVQLPVYNETAVVLRLLETISRQNYPAGRWQIQVLDDSTDETPELVSTWIARRPVPVPVQHLRRRNRHGFKAGALDEGLHDALAKGIRPDVIAILDADFMPPPDFLRRAAAGFQDPDIGVVQGRWGHHNAEDSWLTRGQAMMLDAHFFVEQAGRQALGCFRAFNGSGGLIRVAALESAGGWRPATLTEDLDLSVRLQLHGWRIRFDESIVVPAELPGDAAAFRVQQHRWMRGVAQNARTHLGAASAARGRTRAHLLWQLLESGTFGAMALSLLLTGPMALGVGSHTVHPLIAVNLPLAGSFVAMAPVYLYAARQRVPSMGRRLWHYAQFVLLSSAQVLPNAVAVGAGWLAGTGEFERTHKTGGGPAIPTRRRTPQRLRGRSFAEAVLAMAILTGSAAALIISPSQALFLWPVASWLLGTALLLLTSARKSSSHDLSKTLDIAPQQAES